MSWSDARGNQTHQSEIEHRVVRKPKTTEFETEDAREESELEDERVPQFVNEESKINQKNCSQRGMSSPLPTGRRGRSKLLPHYPSPQGGGDEGRQRIGIRRKMTSRQTKLTAATGAYAVPSPQGGGVDQSSSPITPPHGEEGMEAGSMLYCVRDKLIVLYCIGGMYTARVRAVIRGSLSSPR